MLLLFTLQQIHVQQKSKLTVQKSKFRSSEIALSKSEFYACRINSNELLYHYKLYEVISIIEKKDKVCVQVIHDVEEDNILNKIKGVEEDTSSPLNGDTSNLLKFCSLNYLLPERKNQIENGFSKHISTLYQNKHCTINITVSISQPPEFS